jgi:rare lipoprotein A
VSNLANGKAVVVRINDRGPFVGDRLIDLSYAAAHRLGVLATGSAMVEVESMIPGVAPPVLAETPAPLRQEPVREPAVAVAPASATEPAAASAPPVPEVPILSDASGVYLQLGAFGSKDNAENFLARLMLQVDWLADRLDVLSRDGLHRVRAGPYANSVEARRIAERVNETLGIRPVMLTR